MDSISEAVTPAEMAWGTELETFEAFVYALKGELETNMLQVTTRHNCL